MLFIGCEGLKYPCVSAVTYAECNFSCVISSGNSNGHWVPGIAACYGKDASVPRCILISLCSFSLLLSLNFKDPEAVRALTCTLLREDFGLSIDIPLERLIPTVPLRLNYIHWVEDLIGHQDSDRTTVRRGIDIGGWLFLP